MRCRLAAASLLVQLGTAQGEVRPAPALAVEWLVRHQEPDGRFDAAHFWKRDPRDQPCDGPGEPFHDVAATALALLAMLGDGNTMRAGTHVGAVRSAVQWLCDQDHAGRIGTAEGPDPDLGHALATLALSEAGMLSSIRSLTNVLPRWLDALPGARQPAALQSGPVPASRPARPAAVLAAGFASLACLSARGQGQWARSDAALRAWLARQAAAAPADAAGRAVAILLRAALGEQVDPDCLAVLPRLRESFEAEWRAGRAVEPATLVLACHAATHAGGDEAAALARAILVHVPPAMRLDGSFAGSFDPHGPSGRFGGRIAATALHLHAWKWAEHCSRPPAVRAAAEPERRPR